LRIEAATLPAELEGILAEILVVMERDIEADRD
jgi:hypothetical protein